MNSMVRDIETEVVRKLLLYYGLNTSKQESFIYTIDSNIYLNTLILPLLTTQHFNTLSPHLNNFTVTVE